MDNSVLKAFHASISIHAPRGGSDREFQAGNGIFLLFQSTLPVGGATRAWADRMLLEYISIHAPRGGSDLLKLRKKIQISLFQSTLPVGGATTLIAFVRAAVRISIHAPRGGSDCKSPEGRTGVASISIHAPRGGSDQGTGTTWQPSELFQSTLPVGGATFQIA